MDMATKLTRIITMVFIFMIRLIRGFFDSCMTNIVVISIVMLRSIMIRMRV